MRLCLILLICGLQQMLSAQENVQDEFDVLVCKESEAHFRVAGHALESNAITEDYDLKYYRFEWYINPALRFIRGSATVYFETLIVDFDEIRFDLSTELIVDSVKHHGLPLLYQQTGAYLLSIQLPSGLSAGTLDSVTIYYAGVPPSNGLGSFELGNHNGIPVLWTLSEPFGTQDWWPCKNGLTDKIDSIDVIITTPQAYRAASNGALVMEDSSGTDKIYHWKHRYPIAPYLVAIAVTNYVHYTDSVSLGNGSLLPMVNYVYPENLATAQAGTQDLVQVLEYFDSLFVTYPFHEEKYGHAQFGWGGGMEHQTMSFVTGFGWTLLSHELAHQWFGDMVTCGSWEDIWLNEGFATYLEGLSRERFLGEVSWNEWKSSRVNTITSQPGGSVKVSDTTSVNRIFSGRLSYSKGAYLLHMLRWKLGEEAFYQGLRNYLEDMQFSYAKTEDLKAYLEAASGLDLSEFFNDWYTGQGYPSYTVIWDQQDDRFLIEIVQTTSHASVDFFEMPVPVRLVGDGIDTMLRLEHAYSGQQFNVLVSFEVLDVEFDPEIWLISRNNLVMEGELISATENLTIGGIVIYPNPAKEGLIVNIENGVYHNSNWRILNMPGQSLKIGSIKSGVTRIDISDLAMGMYLLQIGSESGDLVTRTFVKE